MRACPLVSAAFALVLATTIRAGAFGAAKNDVQDGADTPGTDGRQIVKVGTNLGTGIGVQRRQVAEPPCSYGTGGRTRNDKTLRSEDFESPVR